MPIRHDGLHLMKDVRVVAHTASIGQGLIKESSSELPGSPGSPIDDPPSERTDSLTHSVEKESLPDCRPNEKRGRFGSKETCLIDDEATSSVAPNTTDEPPEQVDIEPHLSYLLGVGEVCLSYKIPKNPQIISLIDGRTFQ